MYDAINNDVFVLIIYYFSHFLTFLYVDAVRVVRSKGLALLVPRNIEKFPHNKDRLTGTIDIWWIIRILLQMNILYSSMEITLN